MKKTLLTICCAGITLAANAQWLRSLGGPSEDRGKAIAVDQSGNVYTTGWCSFNPDLDPGPGTATISTASDDAFVSKLDANGNFVWAKKLGGNSTDYGHAIAVDATGNVYTTGKFKSAIDLDPSAATYTLASSGDFDVFISKLDASGNFVWGKTIGGGDEDVANGIAIDAQGNVYITGYFNSGSDFDPGIGTTILTSNGFTDIFILKLDASGNFVWVKNIGGNKVDGGNAIKVDAAGNIYTTGYFRNTVDFDPGAGVSNLTDASTGIFVSKLDASGNFLWAGQMGASSSDKGLSIDVDGTGNVYTTGVTTDGADFDPGAGVYTLTTGSAGSSVSFISKLDASGNFVWAKGFGGSGSAYGESVAVDPNGNVYTTGYFTNLIDFDPGAGAYTYSTSSTNSDIYISKLDPNGNFLWAKYMGGGSSDNGYSITTDAAGNVYSTGSYYYIADFSSGAGTTTLTSAGFFDVFIMKMDPSGSFDSGNVGVKESTLPSGIHIYPNPSAGILTISSVNELSEIKILNLLGETVYNSTANSAHVVIDLADKARGVYFYQLMDNKRKLHTGKIIIE